MPTTRQELINYCLRKLGEPVIRVNVAPEQIQDRIDDTLKKFYEHHYAAVETVYLYSEITEDDANNGYIRLDNDIAGVAEIFRPQQAYGLSNLEFKVFIEDVLGYGRNAFSGNLVNYYMTQSNLTLMNRFFSPVRQWEFNHISKKLTIAGGLRATMVRDGGMFIKAFKKLKTTDDDISSNEDFNNIWDTRWIRDYATALIRQQWAQNLSKFQQVQLVGGVTMSGSEMFQQAQTEIKELEEELKTSYEFPVEFFWA